MVKVVAKLEGYALLPFEKGSWLDSAHSPLSAI